MAKDPAVLFFIDKWLVATKGMKADCRGWFLNLILHQFDKGELPNDIEELANYADVRISEFERFKQVFEQVLKHKFKQTESGGLENGIAKEIMKGREQFKEKRETAGKLSYFLKYVRTHFCKDENIIQAIKPLIDLSTIDVKKPEQIEHVFKQLLDHLKEQKSELFINVNAIVNTNINTNKEGGAGETRPFEPVGIIPEMLRQFRFSNPHYPAQQTVDFPALLGISTQILDWQKLPGDITAPKNTKEIKLRWGELVPFIRAHNHFSGYSLTQVNKHFQSIVQSFNSNKNGTHPKAPAGKPVIQNVTEGGFGQL
jgi:hypothetical protein